MVKRQMCDPYESSCHGGGLHCCLKVLGLVQEVIIVKVGCLFSVISGQ